MSIKTALDKIDWKCTVCGVSTKIGCACWVRCRCGWSYRAGGTCRNGVHAAEG